MYKIQSIALLATATMMVAACGNSNQKKTDGSDTATASTIERVRIEKLTNGTPGPEKKSFFLRITDEVKTDSSRIYTTKSIYNKDTVGAKIEVVDFIPAGIIDGQPSDDVGFTKGKIKITTLGTQSDNLVKALGELFQMPTTDGFTKEVVLPNVFSSNKVNVDLSKKTAYSFKLFLENKKAEPAELFFNVDTYKHSIEFSEKDPSFRAGFISALTGK
ncbi:hypothetical protein BWD42_05795 [Sphingobacterium sp. CZ-UAM]|uniref:hypothetical protein n=1 Tax=Sphingobacterium sp. CZ-UAM TaxID=1933868 RepID=UPI0009CB956B|nr:hypothetical protein [Sphingobacterium sp. CZ-UAM]OOG20339.1 hypothetical protein BWD42_05795 [Sphingobacterium sp. CZ-UAM]